MIFVTVGMQMPFNRLVNVVLKWAHSNYYKDIIFQVGPNGLSIDDYESIEFIDPECFQAYISEADLIISHAGMGTILKALELAKPLIIMPRRSDLKETRNDHQKFTAQKFSKYSTISSVYNEEELFSAIDNSLSVKAMENISPYASAELIEYINDFIVKAVRNQTSFR